MQRAKKRVNRKAKGRQAKIYKQPNSTVFNSNIESTQLIRIITGSAGITFTTGGQQYLDVAVLLSGSTSFTEMSSRFSMYRINSLKLEMRSLFAPPTNGITEHVFLGAGFFPSMTTVSAGNSLVVNYDKALIASTTQTLMSRKQTFYNNYFEGTGAGGYGTWNSVSSVASLSGSVQIGSQITSSNATNNTVIAVLRIIWNVTFKEKQLTG